MVLKQNSEVPCLSVPIRPSASPQMAAEAGRSFADATSKSITHEYVEIDLTTNNDCYNLPEASKVAHAIRNVFGEDDDRVTHAPRRGNAGVWTIETPNLDRYRQINDLIYEGITLGRVSVRSQKITVMEDGRIQRKFEHSPNDLLITLRDADSHLLRHVTNEQILEKIVDMGIGTIKKSVQRQIHRPSGEYSGNKFFVLQNVTPENRKNIPECFVFEVPTLGKLKMWVNHRYQLRKCGFCGEKHDAVCKIREKVNDLVNEREKIRMEEGFKVKTYSDSTLRYANQAALQSDIDAMSGGTVGNIVNAIGVDNRNTAVTNIVIMAGANEKRMNLTPAEYITSLAIIRDSVIALVQLKSNVALVPPPKPLGLMSPEDVVKEEIFDDHLKKIEESGVKVWKNPIAYYDEDWGLHPSMTQTAELLEFINHKVYEEFKLPYQLPSASQEVLALPNKYSNVTSLYKYGCAACGRKERNRWPNICDGCKAEAANAEGLAEDFVKRVEAVFDEENPALSDGDHIKCEHCDVVFEDIKDLRNHFSEEHPDIEPKSKRTKSSQLNEDGKKGRRAKATPSKSL